MSFHIEGWKGPFKVKVWLTGNPGKPNKEKEKFQIDHEFLGSEPTRNLDKTLIKA